MHVLFLFVDGVGLGSNDAAVNPFAGLHLAGFEKLAGGQRWTNEAAPVMRNDLVFKGIDANLGVDGLPQSGTGQATLFTGVNCATLAGRHYGPYPHSTTKEVIAERNVFRQLDEIFTDESEPGAFANAYPEKFFEYVKKTDRWTVTTRCCLASRTRIRSRSDLLRGEAVPADLLGRRWPEAIQNGMMPRSEAEAAQRLLAIGRKHRLTMLEYYLTDKAGHRQSLSAASEVLTSVDRLLRELVAHMDPADTLLLLTSDHGNIEDLSTKSHTRNPVPLAAYGRGAAHLSRSQSLSDVTPALISIIREAGS